MNLKDLSAGELTLGVHFPAKKIEGNPLRPIQKYCQRWTIRFKELSQFCIAESFDSDKMRMFATTTKTVKEICLQTHNKSCFLVSPCYDSLQTRY